MSLLVTIGSLATPMVDSTIRLSTRLSIAIGGFHEVQVDKEPSKKRKGNVILIDEKTGSSGPVSVDILQGWGIDCGVAPAELSLEALMKASSSDLSPMKISPSEHYSARVVLSDSSTTLGRFI
jgi:hypothetical protein